MMVRITAGSGLFFVLCDRETSAAGLLFAVRQSRWMWMEGESQSINVLFFVVQVRARAGKRSAVHR